MRWDRVVTILGREYREHTRKKMFWVFSLAVPLLAPLVLVLFGFLMMAGVVKGQKIIIYDGAGLGETLARTLDGTPLMPLRPPGPLCGPAPPRAPAHP